MPLVKPQPETRNSLNYNDCRDWINLAYGVDIDDYAGMFTASPKVPVRDMDNHPFQCFWRYVMETNEIHNGCFFSLTRDEIENVEEPWQAEIINMFFAEFATPDEEDIEFYVWW